MNKAKPVNDSDTGDNAKKYVQFELKNMVGEYIAKYFHYESTSMMYGNVYSGICHFRVKNYNKLEVEVNKEKKTIKINWRIYTIEPNSSQWIGICDERNKLRHYEYVCYHTYSNDSKMQGTMILENNKFIDEFFSNNKNGVKSNENTKEMEKTIEKEKNENTGEKTWKIKFYNKGLIMSSKLMEIPLRK